MSRVKVKAKFGKFVRNPYKPGYPVLAQEGEYVVYDSFWSKRVSQGDVEIISEESQQKKAKPAKVKEAKKEEVKNGDKL